jgi:hypothetical protein
MTAIAVKLCDADEKWSKQGHSIDGERDPDGILKKVEDMKNCYSLKDGWGTGDEMESYVSWPCRDDAVLVLCFQIQLLVNYAYNVVVFVWTANKKVQEFGNQLATTSHVT